jgi:hypothetical protein
MCQKLKKLAINVKADAPRTPQPEIVTLDASKLGVEPALPDGGG